MTMSLPRLSGRLASLVAAASAAPELMPTCTATPLKPLFYCLKHRTNPESLNTLKPLKPRGCSETPEVTA